MQPVQMEDSVSSDTESGCCKQNEKRKSSKPVMEKRRRARINSSLNELKEILLEAMKKDSTRHSKLEKADILEMTVKYLRNVERQKLSVALSIDPTIVDKYKSGFNECRNEVMRFLSTCEGVNVDVRTRLLNHLEMCHRSLSSSNVSLSRDIFSDHVSIPSHSPIKLAPSTQSNQMHFSTINLDQSSSTLQMHLPTSTRSVPLPTNMQNISGMTFSPQVAPTKIQHQNQTTAVLLKGNLQIAPKHFPQSSASGDKITVLVPSSQIGHTAYLSPVSLSNQFQTVELVTARPVEVSYNLQENAPQTLGTQILQSNSFLSKDKPTASSSNKCAVESNNSDNKRSKSETSKKQTANKKRQKRATYSNESSEKKIRGSKNSLEKKSRCQTKIEENKNHPFTSLQNNDECRAPIYFETEANPPDTSISPWRPWFSTNLETPPTSKCS